MKAPRGGDEGGGEGRNAKEEEKQLNVESIRKFLRWRNPEKTDPEKLQMTGGFHLSAYPEFAT